MFPIEKFTENGFAVIENFITEVEVTEMKNEILKLLQTKREIKNEKPVFSVGSRTELYKQDYFLKSNDKISLFYEEDGDQVNKIGHALHTLNEKFQKFTFSEKVKNVARELRMQDPVVVQSMYIFKNAKIGGEVRPHQDATYLHTTPNINGVGLWLAMDEADEENGCLRAIVASHKDNLHNDYQLVRECGNSSQTNENNIKEKTKIYTNIKTGVNEGMNKGMNEGMNEGKNEEVNEGMNEGVNEGMNEEINERVSLGYTGKEPSYPENSFIPLPVKKGSLILIDRLLVHSSAPNHSLRKRNAFTLHLFDCSKAAWDPLNWLQASNNDNFVHLYTCQPYH